MQKHKNIVTIKITSPNLTLLAKLKRDTLSRLQTAVASESSILVSSETRNYFCYINLEPEVLAVLLQEITPYGAVKP